MDQTIKEGEFTLQPDPDDKAPNWRDSLEPRIKAHVAYCQDYVAKHNHGAPGHLAHLATDALAKLLDGHTFETTVTHVVEINVSGIEEIQQQIRDLLAKYGGAA